MKKFRLQTMRSLLNLGSGLREFHVQCHVSLPPDPHEHDYVTCCLHKVWPALLWLLAMGCLLQDGTGRKWWRRFWCPKGGLV